MMQIFSETHFYSFTKLLISSKFIASIYKSKSASSGRISTIVNEISRLTLLEVADFGGGSKEESGLLPIMAMMMLGMRVAEKTDKKREASREIFRIQGGFYLMR